MGTIKGEALSLKNNKLCQNGLDLAQSFMYIFQRINPVLVRELAKLSDDDIKLFLTAYTCELMRGIKTAPLKQPKTAIAKALIAKGANKERVISLSGISARTYYRLKSLLTSKKH